ncbi:MAG: flagellar protein FliO/FliZ [Variibacter sp.]|jgi:hypothetical protein|nr:flagellar protein FliO/FliZ [Variibacter sp.]
MIDSLLGVDLPLPVKLVVAFVVVLALIALATWVFRRVGGTRVGTSSGRGRQPRLAVIDAAPIDGRRRLVLIRRDNVEHLIMIGGPTDVVVEQNIVRAVPVNQPRDGGGPRAELGRGAPEPRGAAEPRNLAEPRMPPEPARAAPMSELPPPRPARAEPAMRMPPRRMEPAPPPRPERRPVAPLPPARERESVDMHSAPPTSDPHLVDMAQKLEAALRPPAAPAADPTEPVAPDVPVAAPQGSNGRAVSAAQPAPAADNKNAPRSVFDSLEEEMASLLGKPPSKP